MSLALIDDQTLFKKIVSLENSFFSDYFAFYSSWFGGVTTNPALMLLPIDDHMVHRGDGVFEAFKVINRSIYLFEEHLARLFYSAEKIGIKCPFSMEKVKEIILETLKIANQTHAGVRVFLSRGPGSFSVNPYDTIGSQLYVVVIRFKGPPEDQYQKGVKIGISQIPTKASWLAQVKSCNYLQNVLMKKEAVDRHLDFVIVTDEKELVSEGATENIMLIDQNGILVFPELENILKGTTLNRVCELSSTIGLQIKERPISITELKSAREVMLTGTTLDVIPVVQIEDVMIGEGKPGAYTLKLRQLILEDIQKGDKGTSF